MLLAGGVAFADEAVGPAGVPVGGYLYAAPAAGQAAAGGMVVHFPGPGKRLVVAYGRKNRKDRISRVGTKESEREVFKPFKADISENGKTATFRGLPPDFYDLIVFDPEKMTLFEGIDMLSDDNPELAAGVAFDEVRKSLGRGENDGRLVSGWESFFDQKRFERFETDGLRGAVLVQQMRHGKAFAESGAEIKGCIHSVDICWVMKGVQEGGGWQVTSRQQLFRDELFSREFFRYQFRPELQAIRIGVQVKDIGILLKDIAAGGK
jgi:hypothetical protein